MPMACQSRSYTAWNLNILQLTTQPQCHAFSRDTDLPASKAFSGNWLKPPTAELARLHKWQHAGVPSSASGGSSAGKSSSPGADPNIFYILKALLMKLVGLPIPEILSVLDVTIKTREKL